MLGQKEVIIEKPSENNEFFLELNLRLSLNNYKLRLATKRKWIIAVLLILIKVAFWKIRDG